MRPPARADAADGGARLMIDQPTSEGESPSHGGRALQPRPTGHDERQNLPGARKTPGVAVARSLLPSRSEWAVRNRVLASNLAELLNDHAPEVTGRAVEI